jgi:hypothetical protein
MKIDSDRYVTADVGDDLFLLDEHTGESFRLGGSAGRVWELLVEGATPAEAAATIAGETGSDPAEVGSDVETFVKLLVEAGIVEDGGP